MKLDVSAKPAAETAGDALVLECYAGSDRFEPEMRRVDLALGGLLALALRDQRFEGRAAEVADVHTGGRLPAKRVLVVGLGPRAECTAEVLRRAAAAGGAPGARSRGGEPRDPGARHPGAGPGGGARGPRRPARGRCSASTASTATRRSGTATGRSRG